MLRFQEALADITGGAARSCGRARRFSAAESAVQGRPARTGRVDVMIRESEGHPVASFRGLLRCGRPHVCPTCSAQLRAEVARDVREAVDWWRAEQGGRVDLLTLTIRLPVAERDTPLGDIVRGLRRAWSRLTGGQPWMRMAARLGVSHMIRVVDFTQSTGGGWHAHIHALLFRRGGRPPTRALGALRARWEAQVTRVLGASCTPSRRQGARVTRMDGDGTYALKLGVETAAAHRYARGVSRPPGGWGSVATRRSAVGLPKASLGRRPWDIALGAALGDPADLRAWQAFAAGIVHLPIASISTTLRAVVRERREARRRERQDAIAELRERLGSAAGAAPTTRVRRVASIPAVIWDVVVRRRGARLAILRAAERGGLPAVAAAVARYGWGPEMSERHGRAAARSVVDWLSRELAPSPAG